MQNTLLYLLILTFFGSIAGLIGGVIFLVKENWARKLSEYAVPFAAGVLLSVSLLHLIPEASDQMGETAFVWVLAAFLFSFFFEEYFAHLHHHEHRKGTMRKATVPLILFGDTVHNFIDGVAIAAAFLADPTFGVIVTAATFLHETPHEIGDFGVLLSAGWSRTKTFIANLLSASATFPGALLVYFVLGPDAHENIGALLAVSAGVFLYLGASDFLPEVGDNHDHEHGISTRKQLLLLIFGVLLMYGLFLISPEH
jgi:zinc and cadmium transporter